jgi:hypothetical protein
LAQDPLSAGPDADPRAAQARIDEILTALEQRGRDLKDIRCRVHFVEDDRMNLAQRMKEGRILFLFAEPSPRFLIHFERTESDGMLGKQEWYLFDGKWLYQGLERIKQVTKQEIARQGEKVDLFDLEKAPFPLPFGQKKNAILRNFDVSLVPPAPSDPANTDHLECVPKPDSRMYRKYDKLEFFVSRDVNLPARIVVTKKGGLEINTANFPDLSPKSINVGVPERELAPPPVWKKEKYTEVVETLIPKEEGP